MFALKQVSVLTGKSSMLLPSWFHAFLPSFCPATKLAFISTFYLSLEMEALPLIHFNIVRRCCNLWMLFIVSVACFSSYCGACEPFTCGSGPSFGYPFGKGNSGCGDPLLQLNCEDNRPLLDIKGTQYYILKSSSDNISEGIVMTIIDKNLMGKECDPSSSNSTQLWSGDGLHIVDGYNMTLWEGCQDGPPYSLPEAFQLRCNDSFYYDISSNKSWTAKCKSQVQLPATKDLDPLYPGLDPLMKIFQFKIKWMPSSSCKNCTLNKGICAYNATIPFVCIPRGNDSDLKNKPSGGKDKVKVGAIVGGLVGGVVGLAFLFLICTYLRRKKEKENKSHPLPDRSTLIAKDVKNSYSIDIEAGVQAKIGNLPIFSYEILKQATDNFDDNNMLGDGGFGTVYLGKLPDGRTVAVKRMYQDNYRKVEQFINEIEILSCLHHPNLVRLYGCTSPESRDLLLVYEYVSNGTVADHLHGEKKGKGLNWDTRLKISLETAQALVFLHSQEPPVLHRDVKTTNILLDENFKVKVADFGLSRFMPPDVTHVSTAPQGTPGYVDPEYYQCFQLTEKSDVYSFGVVLVEIISGKLAVDINRSRNEITLANMAITKIKDGALHELVDPCLGYDSDDKIKAGVTAISELAFSCLHSIKDDRPYMKEIVAQLDQIQKNWSDSGKDKVFKGMAPPSPTSVQDPWLSTKTTPNNSG